MTVPSSLLVCSQNCLLSVKYFKASVAMSLTLPSVSSGFFSLQFCFLRKFSKKRTSSFIFPLKRRWKKVFAIYVSQIQYYQFKRLSWNQSLSFSPKIFLFFLVTLLTSWTTSAILVVLDLLFAVFFFLVPLEVSEITFWTVFSSNWSDCFPRVSRMASLHFFVPSLISWHCLSLPALSK